MPYTTVWEDKGVCWIYSGALSSKEILESNNEFYQDSRSDHVSYQIINLTDVENIVFDDLSMEEISAIDYAQSMSVQKLKVAFVCKQVEILQHINEYIGYSKALQSSWKFKIFDELEDAKLWAFQPG